MKIRKKNRHIFILCLYLVVCCVYSQNRVADSLRRILKQTTNDSATISIRYEIGEYGQILRIGYWDSLGADAKFFSENKTNNSPVNKTLRNFYLTQYGLCLNNAGFIYQDHGNILKAIEDYNACLKIQEETNDQPGLATSFNNLGQIYYNQNENEKAFEYYEKSLKIREKINDPQSITYSLSNLGSFFENDGDLEKALDYYHRCLKIEKEIHDDRGITNTLVKIGHIHQLRKENKEALGYFEESLKLCEEIKYNRGMISALDRIGFIYFDEGCTDIAFGYGQRSFNIAKESQSPLLIRIASNLLYRIYKKQNKNEQALQMYGLYIQMRDSISNESNRKATIKTQLKYEYEKKSAADSVKNTEQQNVKDAQLAAQTASLKQEKFQRYSLIVGLSLVVCGLLFVVNRFRITQKQKKIIEEQKIKVDEAFEKLHEKNKEVMDSIRYAKRIQTALLTSEKYIERKLNELKK